MCISIMQIKYQCSNNITVVTKIDTAEPQQFVIEYIIVLYLTLS